MIHPHTELRFIRPEIGHGVVATRRIPAGTIVWTRDPLDRALREEQVAKLPPVLRAQVEKYGYQDRKGLWVLCWDLGRYVNHSCEPNCLSPGWDFEIAVRDIEVGEELLDDYGSLNLHQDFVCACGSPRCRGVVRPDDPVRMAATWDRLLAPAFARLLEVEQPLWPLVKNRRAIERRVATGQPPPSILRNYWAHSTITGLPGTR